METEELTKLVDGIYKNILDKFNPGARQMITAGKAYLKALHGAAAASRLYVEAITKLGRQAQQGTWGGSADIGTALMKVVEVYREIQEQQMNILKAFYVDLLVPLETNLEKDTKVVQSEQKRFLQQHKLRSESYSKAAAAMKRQRKKNTKSTKTSGMAMDKELKNMQILEEEKTKLDAFCEQSLKNAMTQERRRYGFVLERQCSLARHWLAYHAAGSSAYRAAIDDWQEAARSREGLPPAVDAMFISKMRQVSFWADEDVYASPSGRGIGDRGAVSADELERLSMSSQLRKTRSMDASCLDVRSMDRAASPSPAHISRAKSDFNINSSTHSLEDESLNATPTRRPRSMALPSNHDSASQRPSWQAPLPPQQQPPLARALYAYLSSGDNQLSFLEGDIIALLGERNKGWQFGENLRTQLTGWFPLAYTESMDTDVGSPNRWSSLPVPSNGQGSAPGSPASSGRSGSVPAPQQAAPIPGSANPQSNPAPSSRHQTPQQELAPRMFGDTLLTNRNSKQIRRVTASTSAKQANNHGPPPTLPAPVPTPTVPNSLPSQNTQKKMTSSQSATFQTSTPNQTKSATMKNSTSSASGFSSVQDPKSFGPQTLPARVQGQASNKVIPKGVAAVGNASLHSSNDSGFSNEPPPQPEVDYSDEENGPKNRIPIRSSQRRFESHGPGNTHSLQRDRSRNTENGLMYGNHNDRNAYLTDDQQIILRTMIEQEKDGQKVKRTKSFWKFGRSASEDILEGMALWKHRDLVDIVPQYKRQLLLYKEPEMGIPFDYKPQKYNTSENSDTTLKQAPIKHEDKTLDRLEKYKIQKSKSASAIIAPEMNKVEKKAQKTSTNNKVESAKNHHNMKQSQQQRMEEEYNARNDRHSNNSDMTNSSTIKTNFENSFYDDENGEGLVVKTVKRKEILQQYDNESISGSETERNSIASSTDPYDCIIVDDHMTLKKQREMENRRIQAQQAKYNSKMSEKSRDRGYNMSEISDSENNIPIKPHLRATLSSERQKSSNKSQVEQSPQRLGTFKTFKDNESDMKMYSGSNETLKYSEQTRKDDRNYYQSHETDSKKAAKNRRYYEHNDDTQKRRNHHNEHSINTNGRHNSGNYYSEQSDDHKYKDNEQQKPQLLPRTKLMKVNNVGATMQTVMKFEQEIGLMEYRTQPRERSKGHENGEFMTLPGHTYGPWYDLWGREQGARK